MLARGHAGLIIALHKMPLLFHLPMEGGWADICTHITSHQTCLVNFALPFFFLEVGKMNMAISLITWPTATLTWYSI